MDRAAVVLGTGGFALELAGILDRQILRGFVGPQSDRHLPAPHLGGDEVLAEVAKDADVFIAVGKPSLREKLAHTVIGLGLAWKGFVHPAAWVSTRASVGRGVIVYPNSTVHAGTVLGDGVLVNSNVSVGHETRIGAFSNLNPGASLGGCLNIGARTYIGIGAAVIENLTIADDVVVGAGATVVRHLTDAGTYAGVPAAKIS